MPWYWENSCFYQKLSCAALSHVWIPQSMPPSHNQEQCQLYDTPLRDARPHLLPPRTNSIQHHSLPSSCQPIVYSSQHLPHYPMCLQFLPQTDPRYLIKGFGKMTIHHINTMPLSTSLVNLSRYTIRLVRQELLFMNQCWEHIINSLFFR